MVSFAEYQFYQPPIFLSKPSIVEERRISTQDFCPRERLSLRQCNGYALLVALMETQADSG